MCRRHLDERVRKYGNSVGGKGRIYLTEARTADFVSTSFVTPHGTHTKRCDLANLSCCGHLLILLVRPCAGGMMNSQGLTRWPLPEPAERPLNRYPLTPRRFSIQQAWPEKLPSTPRKPSSSRKAISPSPS